MKPPMIVLAGPTAVGKTRLSLALARAVDGEVISADSMQVYRHMDIGSAKISKEQMQGIPHHMIDILDPWEPFNVVIFQQKCRECLKEVYGRGHVPIVTGGTGFYIQALLRDVDFNGTPGERLATSHDHVEAEELAANQAVSPARDGTFPGTASAEGAAAEQAVSPARNDAFPGTASAEGAAAEQAVSPAQDDAYRSALEQLAARQGAEALHEMLRRVDPASAEAIHTNNVKRTIRALEFYHQTGQRISEHNERERQRESAYRSCYFVLTDDRETLYERIDRRVDEMLAAGLVDEVRRLRELGCHREMVSMQGLGYKEILAFLEGEIPYERAVEILKRDTRHFAKRQLTWFRREKDIIWVDRQDFPGREEEKEQAMLAFLLEKLREAGIMAGG